MAQTLLNKLPIGICMVDETYVITYLNAFFLDRMSPELRENAVGQPLGDVFPEQIKFLKRRIKSVFVLKHPSFSYWEQRPHIFPFKSSRPITGEETQMVQNMEIVPHKNPDTGVLSACILIQDVTAQASYYKAQVQLSEALREEHNAQRKLIRKLDRAQAQLLQAEKMASTGQLAAGIAHEINNPMGFVSANLATLTQYADYLCQAIDHSQTLIESHSDNALKAAFCSVLQAQHIDMVRDDISPLIKESIDGLDRIRDIVGTLRAFAEDVQQGWGMLNIDETARQIVQLVGLQYKTPTYKVSCEPANLKWYCDPVGIKQALINILTNAAQSISDKGLVMLSVKQSKEHLHIKIIDTGCGISKQHQPRVFEPFFSTRPEGTGRGLGLSVAYSAIESHNGKMRMNSTEGKGTVVDIVLPGQTHPKQVSTANPLPASENE